MIPRNDILKMIEIAEASTEKPASFGHWPEDADPVEWFAQMINLSPGTLIFGVFHSPESGLQQISITGNGPCSEENAIFQAACHNNMLTVLQELLRLQDALEAFKADVLDAEINVPLQTQLMNTAPAELHTWIADLLDATNSYR